MILFTKIYRLAWLVLIVLLIFLDRTNPYWIGGSIFLLLILAAIAVLRALESRKEWREIIEEENLDKDIP